MLYYSIGKDNIEEMNGIFSEFEKAVIPEHKHNIMTIATRLEQKGIKKSKTQGAENVHSRLIAKFTAMIVEETNDELKGN